ADGEAEEALHLHRSVDQPLERSAAGIGEQQRCSTAPADKRKWPRRPCILEIVSPPAEDALAILPQDLEIANPISVELKGWVQLPHSAAPPRSRFARLPPRHCR